MGTKITSVGSALGRSTSAERAVSEQRHRLVDMQRRQWILVLTGKMQRRATRHEHRQIGGFEQSGQQRRGVQHLLEVVDEQQKPAPAAKVLCQGILHGHAALAQRLRDRRCDERRIGDRRELDVGHVPGEVGREISSRFDREARLSHPP